MHCFVVILIIFFGLLITVGCETDPANDEDVLAIVGERTISRQDFIERYRYFRQKTGDGVPDTYDARRNVLNSYVAEYVLIAQAEQRGYASDGEGQHERARIQMQQLLNTFNRECILKDIRVDENELKELYARLNTRLRARHIYARTRAEADSLYAGLVSGNASFHELAKSVFEDPKLRDSGGDLGFFTVDEMEPGFEDAAYALRIGEVSKPIKTTDGYSIIRVDKRVTKPFMTETDYAQYRDRLYGFQKRRKEKDAIVAFTDSASKLLDIRFNESISRQVYDILRVRTGGQGGHSLELDSLDPALKGSEIVRSDLGTWDVATLQAKARFTSTGQHKWIRSYEDFEKFIAGLVVRDFVLREAENAGLKKDEKYQADVKREWEDYLYERILSDIREEMTVSQDSIQRYYSADPSLFATQPEINLRQIVVEDAGRAELISEKLAAGVPFSKLAKQYSLHSETAKQGGETGFLRPPDLGRWQSAVFTLEQGQRLGPAKVDSLLVFVECIEKRPARMRSMQEARDDVIEAVKFANWPEYHDARVSEFRETIHPVMIYPEKLKSLNLSQVAAIKAQGAVK